MYYTNANALTNKVSELSVISKNPAVGILCACETHFTKDLLDAELAIPNFELFREDRAIGKKGGGSAIYVRKDFHAEKLDWFKDTDTIALKIKLPSCELYVICMYRSTAFKTIEENEKLLSQISCIPTDCDKNILIVGDLNLPDVDWSRGIVISPENSIDKKINMQCEFLDTFIAKGFKWYIEDKVTRIRRVDGNLQQSTLDQVLATNENLVNCVDVCAPLGKSDHVSLMVELNVNVNLDFINTKSKNWYKVNSDFVNAHATNIDWGYTENANSVDDMWNELNHKMLSISDKIPETVIKSNRKGEILEKLPWDSSKLVRKRKEKDQAWKAFDDNPNMIEFQTALFKQDQYACVEYDAKIKYEKKIVSALKRNSKPYFRYLRSKNKLRKTVNELDNNKGQRSKTPLETAETLLEFFQSVFMKESFGPLPEECYKSEHVLASEMQKPNIDKDKVKKLLQNLKENKAMGPDNIHPKLLKFLGENDNFVEALTQLLNKCVDQECIPAVWKSAMVVPIHKKGSVHKAENYRPVSLTCILCKLYETILRQHILSYVIDMISAHQHGFMGGRSCLSNLLETLDSVNEFLANGNCVDLLYFDFSKAFDTVSHYRLMVKLESMGFSKNMINILNNFLSDRTMQVKVGDSVSNATHVPSGVPQGSVLGPLLFLLFINDLPQHIKNEIKIFADDVKMVADPREKESIQSDLNNLCVWENVWLLKFNLEKCKVMHVGRNNPQNAYNFLGETLPICTEEKDLGVTFNEKFSFHEHIYASISKAKSCLAWLLRNTLSRDPYVMKTAYKSLVRHNLEYCCQVWAPKTRHGNWKAILDIEAVQRTFTRAVEGMQDLNYEQRLKKLGLTTLLERRMRGDLIETFKILTGVNNYGSSFFNLSCRTNNLVSRPLHLTNPDFFSERVKNYWNKLPEYVKNKNNVNSFKNALDKFRLNGIENNLQGQFWELSHEIFRRI